MTKHLYRNARVAEFDWEESAISYVAVPEETRN